jgi:hypothetical protein
MTVYVLFVDVVHSLSIAVVVQVDLHQRLRILA